MRYHKEVIMNTQQLQQINVDQLPHSLQVLIDCIGVEQAYRLTQLYGGRPRYIPKHPQRTALAEHLDAESVVALIQRFAGMALEIPKADHFLRQWRNQQIHHETRNGISRSVLAHKYGLSQRQIGNIRRNGAL